MPITADPIDVDTIVVPDDLAKILQKHRTTPTFNTVLAKHRKLVSPLRKQVWPVATAPEDPEEPAPEPSDAPEVTPTPEPSAAPEAPAPTPESNPGEPDYPTVDR